MKLATDSEPYLACAGLLLACADAGFGTDAPPKDKSRAQAAFMALMHAARVAGFKQADIALTIFERGTFERAKSMAMEIAAFVSVAEFESALATSGMGAD